MLWTKTACVPSRLGLRPGLVLTFYLFLNVTVSSAQFRTLSDVPDASRSLISCCLAKTLIIIATNVRLVKT